MTYKVYYLLNPMDDSIFYVGRTRSDLKVRLQQHLWNKGRNNPELYNKLEYIISCGYRPEIVLIEETNYLQRELELLEEYGKKHNLLNAVVKGKKINRNMFV